MENIPEKNFDFHYWEKIKEYCDTYILDAKKEIAKYDVSEFSNESLFKASILSAIQELKLNFTEKYIREMLSTLEAHKKAQKLGLSDEEYKNPNIRKSKQSGQTDMFIDNT